MEIPVLVIPQPHGFEASTGGPLNLFAVGPTEDAAVSSLRTLLATKLQHGGHVRTITLTDVSAILAAAKKVGESPLFDDWARAVEDYRQQHNTVPDAD